MDTEAITRKWRGRWMWRVIAVTGALFAAAAYSASSDAAQPAPTPTQWEQDLWLPSEGNAAQRLAIPSLTQPYYNTVLDVHATMSATEVEFIFSTAGNWHSALRRVLNEQFFPMHPTARNSNLITTSPPISFAQMQTGKVKVGDVLYLNAAPHVVSGPAATLNQLAAAGYLSGPRVDIISSYGNVILKRRGESTIKSFWDLRKIKAGEFASSDPAEGGSYNNYRNSVLNIALNNPRDPLLTPEQVAAEATALQAQLFDTAGVMTIGPPMHRSVPHLVASGEARAGLFFLHLAVTAMRENPGVFTAVYLAQDRIGETDDPDVLAQGQIPLAGNQANLFQVARTATPVNYAQGMARDDFIAMLQSPQFTQILIDTGLKRP